MLSLNSPKVSVTSKLDRVMVASKAGVFQMGSLGFLDSEVLSYFGAHTQDT